MTEIAKHLHPGPTSNTGANRTWIGTEPESLRQNGQTTNAQEADAVGQSATHELPEEDHK